MRRRHALVAGAALLGAVALTGCGEKFNDAPVSDNDTTPGVIMAMPDQFSNVATKCVPMMEGKRMFVSSNDQAARPVIVDDPNCHKEQ